MIELAGDRLHAGGIEPRERSGGLLRDPAAPDLRSAVGDPALAIKHVLVRKGHAFVGRLLFYGDEGVDARLPAGDACQASIRQLA